MVISIEARNTAMTTIFSKFLQSNTELNFAVVTRKGKIIFEKGDRFSGSTLLRTRVWGDILTSFQWPLSAQFTYEQGQLFIVHIHIGYLVLSLQEETLPQKLRRGCFSIRKTLADPAIRKNVLIQLLQQKSEEPKIHIVEELSPFASEDVALALMVFIQDDVRVDDDSRVPLLIAVCQLLGDCNYPGALGPLRKFLELCTEAGKDGCGDLEQAVKVSIKQLELEAYAEEEKSSSTNDQSRVNFGPESSTSIPEAGEATGSMVDKKDLPEELKGASDQIKNDSDARSLQDEKKIKLLLAKGKKSEAVALIMRYVEVAAKKKMFAKAEKLRQTIINIDSMMISEIIRAAEIIEEEKKAAINDDHRATWSNLVQVLGDDEFSVLYHSMDILQYKRGDTLVSQGDVLSTIFLVNSGELQLSAKVGNSELSLRRVEAGEVVEGGTVFDTSVWTVNVRSLGAEVFLLSRKALSNLNEEYPSIESKFKEFCSTFSVASDTLKKKRVTRRKYERESIGGRANVVATPKGGRGERKKIKADLFDISQGGLSFCVRASRKKNAEMLFGNRVRISLPGITEQPESDTLSGIVVAIRPHPGVNNEYSVHVRFDEVLPPTDFKLLLEKQRNIVK